MTAQEFRFGVNLVSLAGAAPGEAWRATCRDAEAMGYDVLLVPDHLGGPAPFPALLAAAEATERARVGTFVLNLGFWNPALLAREVATTDALTGGRLELGVGTGYAVTEHESAGLPFLPPGPRVDHVRHTVAELDRLLGSPDHRPAPVQQPRVPLMIGGNGNRMLELAARHADITAFAGLRPVPHDPAGKLAALSAGELDERVAAHRGFAAADGRRQELNLLIQRVVVTDDRRAAAGALQPYAPHLTDDQVLDLPVLLVGTVRQIADKVRAHRERYGFTYFTVLEPSMATFAPVIAELRG